ncbi:MAG: ABC transporter transmembrane domain-containing protein [Micrococcaceae bacterium]
MTAEQPARDETEPRMPRVWAGRRRLLLIQLVGCGVAQAVAGLAMALLVETLLSAASAVPGVDPVHPMPTGLLVAGLIGSVLGIGVIRWIERIVAEDLGQDYVFEQRRRLVTAAFGGAGNRSLGVIVTRASNDLTAVRTWISRGLVPLLTGLPLILVVLGALTVSHLVIAAAVAVPLLVMAGLLPWLARLARQRARTVRRMRGRMSARIADAVKAGDSVILAGAVRRELNAVDRDSRKVVDAAVQRSYVTGLIRALTVTAASLSTVAVVLLSTFGWIDTASVASVMTLLGVMAAPLTDLGQVVEYRQNFRAARRVIAPVLHQARALTAAEAERERRWERSAAGPGDVAGDGAAALGVDVVDTTVVRHDAPVRLPALHAAPGSVVQVRSSDPLVRRDALDAVLLAEEDSPARVRIAGADYPLAPLRQRRHLVGVAARHLPLERGSVRRLTAYRTPEATDGEIRWMLDRVGLTETVQGHSRGLGRPLKNDGAPWTSQQAARLKVARAFLGQPPLVVLDEVDQDLDAEGLVRLAELIDRHPGVVLVSSSNPQALLRSPRAAAAVVVWDLDAGPVTAKLPVVHASG